MLRVRVLTALVLLPAAWYLVFRTSPQVFAAVAAALLLVGCWEFHRLAALEFLPWGLALFLVQAGLLALMFEYWSVWTADPLPPLALACLAWGVMLTQLARYRPGRPPDRAYRLRSVANALMVISFGWMALAWLRFEPAGPWWLLSLLLIIWAADIGAYFTGRAFGKAKLAPTLSPGKTWAGLVGGVAMAAVTAGLAGRFLPPLDAPWLVMALLGVITAVVSAGGDLFISMHKRTVGLKDCGKLFPGHGGVLDRLDSLVAGAPFFALGKLLAGM